MANPRVSHVFFAVVLVGLAIIGLIKGDFAPGLLPVPVSMPGRQALAYLCDIIYLACGIGLLWRRTATLAARVLFTYLLLWFLLLRIPWLFVSFTVDIWWSAGCAAVMAGTAWVLYAGLAGDWDRQRLGFFTGDTGLLIARMLFGLGLIPFGLAHFIYLGATAPLVPGWMLWPVFWSYFTGAAFIAAGLAMILGVFTRLAASLIALQFGLLTLLVWVPRIIEGSMTLFQWNEFVVSILLTAAGCVVADSYRRRPWLAVGRQ
ncbi:MAG TPA: hypothetical protein VHQ01_08360 [Pyrinomonadaceae bacterium]|nr:hypothetical protein [Pyrinomonadaceae bacterium]